MTARGSLRRCFSRTDGHQHPQCVEDLEGAGVTERELREAQLLAALVAAVQAEQCRPRALALELMATPALKKPAKFPRSFRLMR